MKISVKNLIVGTLALFLLAGSNVVAESDAESFDPPEMSTIDKFSLSQKVGWVEGQVPAVKRIKKRVEGRLSEARSEKDPIRIGCLDDKLTQINVNITGVEERSANLREFFDSRDNSAAEQQFNIVKIYISRVYGLMAEAENCIGEKDRVVGESDTIVSIDDGITDQNPSDQQGEIAEIDPLPHVSAYY